MGDLSENFGYQEAKARLRRINDRILALAERVASAIPIPSNASDGLVRIGSTVTLLSNGQEQVYEILGSQETNPLRGRISYLSPLGQGLMGRTTSDEVRVNERIYKILSIE